MTHFWHAVFSSGLKLTGLVFVALAIAGSFVTAFYLCQGKVLWTFGAGVLAIAFGLIGCAFLVLG